MILININQQSKTHAEGTTKEEGIKINLSLTCLGCVIMEISKGKGEVPIRLKDSKLTMILKESFLGNCRLTLLVTYKIYLIKFNHRKKLNEKTKLKFLVHQY